MKKNAVNEFANFIKVLQKMTQLRTLVLSPRVNSPIFLESKDIFNSIHQLKLEKLSLDFSKAQLSDFIIAKAIDTISRLPTLKTLSLNFDSRM